MICGFCRHWIATSEAQYDDRMRKMRELPQATPYPCPRCGGTEWAITKAPDIVVGRNGSFIVGFTIGVFTGLVVAVLMAVTKWS